VEPLARIGEILETYVNKASKRLDISEVIANPLDNKESIDMWMTSLGLGEFQSRESRGYVAVLSETGEDMTILKGTVLTYSAEEIPLTVDNTVVVGKSGTSYTKYGEGAYMVEIPVTCLNKATGYISPGVPVNWVGAPSHIYDIYTSSSIAGGRPEQTYQEKALMIKDALSTKSFVGEECIASALRRAFPGEIVDARIIRGGQDTKKSVVTICVKPVSPPTVAEIDAETVIDSDGNIFVTINDPGFIQAVGVLRKNDNFNELHINKVESFIGEDGYYAYRVFIDAKPSDVDVTVKYTTMTAISACANWINRTVNGLPFTYSVIPPQITTIGLYIPCTPELPIATKSAIQAHINTKPLDAELTDSELGNILNSYGITLDGSIIYTKTNNSGGTGEITSTTIGSVNPYTGASFTGNSTAMYTYIDKINNND
jgi:hypothetical protein